MRLCERPDCSAPAACRYGFDPSRRLVWIEPVPDESTATSGAVHGARPGALCRRHADSMVVPGGWVLDDRRQASPTLFATPVDVPSKPRRRARHRAVQMGEQLGLLDAPPIGGEASVDDRVAAGTDEGTQGAVAPTGEAAGPDVTGVVEESATPWRPVFDQNDDLGGLLRARSPLLSRAFRGRNPR